MDKLQLIAEIKRLVGNADIEHALQRLVEELEKAGSSFANDAIQAQSLFQKTQKDEKQGLVSFENARLNYNQVTDQILDLLEALKKESGSEIQRKPAKRLLPWIVGGVLALAAIVALVFSNGKEDPPVQITGDPKCPGFDSTSVFKVLVFPFQPLEPKEKRIFTTTHLTIKNKLVGLSETLGINASIQNYKYDFVPDINYENYPGTPSVAAKTLGSDCQANLIIIGTTEMLASGSITNLKYKFLNSKYTELKITENSVIDTLTSVSSLLSENSLTSDIENTMKILFGVIAKETGNPDAAIAALEKVETTDTTATLLWGMALADSYMAAGQDEKARNTYDKVLEKHPHYWLALKNRAVLNFQKGNEAEALEDCNTLVEVRMKQVEEKNDTTTRNGLTEALVTRSTLHLKTQALDKAEQDINEASKVNPAYPGIRRMKDDVKDQIKFQRDLKTKAETSLRANPEDTKALEVKAGADKALGNEKEALSAARAAVANNSTDPQVFSIVLEEAKRTRDTNTFKRIVKKAEQAGISRKELIQNAPLLKESFKTTIRQ